MPAIHTTTHQPGDPISAHGATHTIRHVTDLHIVLDDGTTITRVDDH